VGRTGCVWASQAMITGHSLAFVRIVHGLVVALIVDHSWIGHGLLVGKPLCRHGRITNGLGSCFVSGPCLLYLGHLKASECEASQVERKRELACPSVRERNVLPLLQPFGPTVPSNIDFCDFVDDNQN